MRRDQADLVLGVSVGIETVVLSGSGLGESNWEDGCDEEDQQVNADCQDALRGLTWAAWRG